MARAKDKPQHEEAGADWTDRVRVYAKTVSGPFRRAKWAIAAFCLAVYYILPWIRWDRGPGRAGQAVLFDLSGERFYFFDLELWPQEIYLLAGLLMLTAVVFFLVGSLFGRVWCGYGCPQTVWTDLFMLVERRVEGDRTERMRRDRQVLSFDTAWRKGVKHAIWLVIAFSTGGAWIFYYTDAPTMLGQFWTGRASLEVYLFTGLFTATTYLLAGWAREQVCTHMCPWPRLQRAMVDEQTFTVIYQAWRGEPRAKGKRDQIREGAGDCIDCGQCVVVCPTGIDIRDGMQRDCIDCGLCIDACNAIMDKLHRPRGLIAWDTLARQGAKLQGLVAPFRPMRARTLFYVTLMVIGGTLVSTALLSRHIITLEAERDRAPLFVMLRDGSVRNGYTIKVVNKTIRDSRMQLRLEGVAGAMMAVAKSGVPPADTVSLPVAPDAVGTYRVLVIAPPNAVAGLKPLDFRLRDPKTGEEAVFHSTFLGPGADQED